MIPCILFSINGYKTSNKIKQTLWLKASVQELVKLIFKRPIK